MWEIFMLRDVAKKNEKFNWHPHTHIWIIDKVHEYVDTREAIRNLI